MKPITIVAIDFSSSNIAPLLSFFDHTPLDHTAYIVLSPLSPNSRTDLQAQISKHSVLQIVDAVSHRPLEKDKVYIAAASESITINRNLQLTVRKQNVFLPMVSVQLFLDSLAKARPLKLAVVLLSASGDALAASIAAIKAAGGLVITAVPMAAVDPDYILPPETMPAMLTRWTENQWMPLTAPGSVPSLEERLAVHFLRQMGGAIKYQRKKKQISQQQLANLCQMQKASLSRTEAGKNNITVWSLHRVARALGVDMQDLF